MRFRPLGLLLVLGVLAAAGCGDDSGGSGEPSAQAAEALGVGTSVDFAEWNIGITGATRDDDIVPYEPEPGVEYAGFRVEVTGTYSGEGESSIPIDFTISYVGTDNRVYSDFHSYRGNGRPLRDGPNVVAGGTQTVEFSLAVPTTALGANHVTLNSSASPADGPAWDVGI